MRLALTAELRKLHRPLTWSVLGGVLLVGALLAAILTHNGHQASAAFTASPPSALACQRVPAACTSGTRSDSTSDLVRRQAIVDVTRAQAIQQPAGALVASAALWSSPVAAFALSLLVAGHVAGEWSGGTLAQVMCAEPSRARLLLAKFATVWGSALSAAIVTAPVLWLVGHAIGPLGLAPPTVPIGVSWTSGLGALFRGAC